jgi:hypothetical protein
MTSNPDANPYIYDYLIRPFVDAQAQAQAAHGDAAENLRAIAGFYRAAAERLIAASAHIEGVAEAHERLAVAVPAVAQAAADLGTAAERHDVNNLRAVVVGEQGLAALLAHDVEALKADVRALRERHDAADEWRGEILRLLRKLNGESETHA